MKIVQYSSIILSLIFLSLCLLVVCWTYTPNGRLNIKVAILLKYISVMQIDLFKKGRSIDQVRTFSAKSSRIIQATAVPIKQINDRTLPEPSGPVPIRVYTDKEERGLPIVIYCHGGGWIMGNLDTHDNTCRSIAKKAGVIVIAPDYGLAPENPYPKGLDDVYATLVWVWKNAIELGGNPNKIFLAGDSSGGNLAAATAIKARDSQAPPLAGQILIYPVLNLNDFNTKSYGIFSDGYYLTRRYMEKFRDYYVPNPVDRISPMVSPLLASNLKQLPPTLVVTAQFDVLRDEGNDYAQRLKKDRVTVELIRVKGVIHGFLKMDRILSQADATLEDIALFIDKVVSK